MLSLILQRARRHWPLYLTLLLGVILAISLLVSGPLLIHRVIEIGLALTLQQASNTQAHLQIRSLQPMTDLDWEALDAAIQDHLEATLADHVDRIHFNVSSPEFIPWIGGHLATDRRVTLQFEEGIQERSVSLAGHWPEAGGPVGDVIPAAISDDMALRYGLRVGDRLPLSQTMDSTRPDLWMEISGIIHPQELRIPSWASSQHLLSSDPGHRDIVRDRAILPADSLKALLNDLSAPEAAWPAWQVYLRHDDITAGQIPLLGQQILQLETEIQALNPGIATETQVPEILTRFQVQLESIRVPLYILLAEVMLLIFYFISIVTRLALDQMEREFAILRSRGSSRQQILSLQLVEALIVVCTGLVIGPWLGKWLVNGLSWLGPLAGIARMRSEPLSQSAWIAAGIGAFISLIALTLPLRSLLKRDIVAQQQLAARPSPHLWWQRLYLDVVLLIGGLFLLWRLRLYGEMPAGTPGGASLDWLLLLAPIAFLVGTATLLLRLFPLVLRLAATVTSRHRGFSAALALWRLARDPAHVNRLVLLLTLAVALGILSTGINTTLDQSEKDRATYLAGKDLRLTSAQSIPLLDLQSIPRVTSLASAWRGQGQIAKKEPAPDADVHILALEPESFSAVTAYRPDFSSEDIGVLLQSLAVAEGEHPSLLQLQGEPAQLGLWLWGPNENKGEMDSYHRRIDGDSDAERVGLIAKLQTAQGELFSLHLQRTDGDSTAIPLPRRLDLQWFSEMSDMGLRIHVKPDTQGWHFFQSSVPALPATSYPLSLHSLWFQNLATREGEPIAKGMNLVLDDLSVVDAISGQTHVVEDFEGDDRTLFLITMQEDSIYFGLFTRLVEGTAHSGKWAQSISMSFTAPGQVYPLRLRQVWENEPLPALANQTFIEATQLSPGDVTRVNVMGRDVDFRITGILHFFPTMVEEADGNFLITSRDLLIALFNETAQAATNPNEVLLDTGGQVGISDLEMMMPSLGVGWRAETVRAAMKANPLALGLRSVTYLGFILTVFMGLAGYATYFYLSVRQRETQYGVLRALGASPSQLFRSILFEQAILITAGLILGTFLGILLNQITLPRLPVTLGEHPPIPPFAPRNDWLAIAQLILILVLAYFLIMSAVTILLHRARIHRILRIGQE